MHAIKILATQTQDAYAWVNKLIQAIPLEKWDETPTILESNVSWQVGHLLTSYYYHAVMSIVGHQKDIFGMVPLREYSALYVQAPATDSVAKTPPATLLAHLHLMEKRSLDVIKGLNPEVLDQPLEPLKIPHPVAKTKFEALDFNIKHTMWHCGQLATLKRIIHKKYDFGLRTS